MSISLYTLFWAPKGQSAYVADACTLGQAVANHIMKLSAEGMNLDDNLHALERGEPGRFVDETAVA